MANVSRPAGLQPVQYRNGNVWNMQGRIYWIPSSDSNAYAIGDPVTLASATADANGVPGITLATAGTNAIIGAIMGFGIGETLLANPANLDTNLIPATGKRAAGYYVSVCDDPDIVFEIEEGGAGAALTSASVNKNTNLLAGTNNGYVSGWKLDNNALGTGATLQLKLLGLSRKADNTFGTAAKWLCVINNHVFAAGTAGF